jgi:protein-S-isoprenylcysteine O-methyltransferase Ste14
MSISEPRSHTLSIPAALDLFEKIVVAGLFGFFVYRMIVAFVDTGNLIYLLLTISESLVVLFILIRRAAIHFSVRPLDWVLALGATAAPLMATPAELAPLLPGLICGLLTFSGLLLQIYAKLTLRRNFGIVAANRGVTTAGPYNFVRHPMYSAYMLTWVGFFLSNPSLWNFAIYAVGFSFQIARLMAEERLLNEDPIYRAFATQVRYRLVPRVF